MSTPLQARPCKHFISGNCAAIPEALLESELFGHEKGAITGVIAPPHRQIRGSQWRHACCSMKFQKWMFVCRLLLRAIQERVIEGVGGTKPVPVDIRNNATSNRSLAEAARNGSFREDLRGKPGSTPNLKIPAAARSGLQDALALAEHLHRQVFAGHRPPRRGHCRPRCCGRRCRSIPWPGNVRELENTLHRAVLLTSGPRKRP